MPSKLIVVGGSAGSIEALLAIIPGLPADLDAALLVVVHTGSADNQLPLVLSRRAALHAVHASDGETIQAGRIYLAPPDHHLLVEGDRMRLNRGPRENRHRPAIDPLFRTAAAAHREHVIGLLLSGALDDGTAGLRAIKASGGLAIVQDPADAIIPTMPQSALTHVNVDFVLPAAAIAPELTRLCAPQATTPRPLPQPLPMPSPPPPPSDPVENSRVFGCPDCGGVLRERSGDGTLQFLCRTGHLYSPEALLAGQSDALEAALWAALRTLEERCSLATRLERSARDRGHSLSEDNFQRMGAEASERAGLIRSVLLGLGLTPQP
ncbi:chemotaxis protein CheB [Chondromyces apiculatus]|uniref:protein-glutamate methylesterase n=1 Tax=Chondromyces apiculatus DSM 436 TaxID=1192034 RepID=A0A017TBG0_9BACT|nr:chemotaxis protein CheB [Chondromyces apiculatus]EYF06160.1 CheB methylesterase [Chondromyces apiculatus DSM 436]